MINIYAYWQVTLVWRLFWNQSLQSVQPSLPTLKILVPLTSWHQKFRRKKPSAGSKYEWQYKIVSPAFCYVELWSKMYLCWAQTFSCPDAQKFGTYASQCDLSQLRPSFEFDIWLATCSCWPGKFNLSSPHVLLPQLEPDTRLWQKPSWRKGNLQLWPPKRRHGLVHSSWAFRSEDADVFPDEGWTHAGARYPIHFLVESDEFQSRVESLQTLNRISSVVYYIAYRMNMWKILRSWRPLLLALSVQRMHCLEFK